MITTTATETVLDLQHRSASNVVSWWDSWPDGDFELDAVPYDAYNAMEKLAEHWANTNSGQRANAKLTTRFGKDGKCSMRSCLGVVLCDNTNCKIVTRPKTRKSRVDEQVIGFCKCGGALSQQSYVYILHTLILDCAHQKC